MLSALSKYIYAANDVLPFDDLPKMIVDNFLPHEVTFILPIRPSRTELRFIKSTHPAFMLLDRALLIYLSTPSMRLELIDLGFPARLEDVERSTEGSRARQILSTLWEIRGLLEEDPEVLHHVLAQRSSGPLPPQAELRELLVIKCYACCIPSFESLKLKRCARCEDAFHCSAE
jgi:hypothetical protein